MASLVSSPVSSPASSPLGNSVASSASSPDNSPPGSPVLGSSIPGPGFNMPQHLRAHQYNPRPPYVTPMPMPPMLAGGPIRYQAPHTKYFQINTPYDFLVSYEYFSEPHGFKPYHFRQCYMPTSGAYIIVEKAWSTQVDLDTYSQILLRYHAHCYTDLRHTCNGDAPESVRRPKVQVCPLFSSEMQRAIDRAIAPELEQDDPKLFSRLKHLAKVEDQIVFFIIVQGREDGASSKLMVKGSFYQIMTEIFSAAANQLSVVFSGAMREKDLPRLGKGSKNWLMKELGITRRIKCEWVYIRSDIRFKRVDNYDDLLEEDADKNVIRVGC